MARAWVAGVLSGGLLAGGALGEPRPGLAEAFEDWTVSCAEAGDAVVCTMAQDVRATGQDARIMGARIDMVAEGAPRLTLILPVGLDLHAPVTLTPVGAGAGSEAEAGAPLAEVRPRVCQRAECYGFLQLTDPLRAALAGEIALRVRLSPFGGEPRDVPISLRGFDDAFSRLQDLAAR